LSDSARDRVRSAFVRATKAFDLEECVARALPPRPPTRARVRVVAVGKAAPAMARGVLRVWGARVERALVVVPDGTPAGDADPRVEVARAGHPLPDARSVHAADRTLEMARGEAKDLLVVLVSGGASALVSAPSEGVTLEETMSLTRVLLASGASIQEMNVVRRHLSRIKGGGLARAAFPARVLTLIASDVIEGAAYDVGSGPTIPDPTTARDAEAELSRWAPDFAKRVRFVETMKADDPAAKRQRDRVVASPAEFADAVAGALEEEGFACEKLDPATADVETMAREYVRSAAGIAKGAAWVRAAEPRLAVTTDSPGHGGRSTHLAALVGRDLPEGVVFLAGASDGVDGSSGLGGAVVDGAFSRLGRARIDEALRAFDTASLHVEAGTGIVLHPTGKNFADVHALARGP
jgi:glycerate 2-kinase